MNRKLIIYLDSCCYSRLFDINVHGKVGAEAAKIRYIIRNRFAGRYIIRGSVIVATELAETRDAKKRGVIVRFYNKIISGEAKSSAWVRIRAKKLELIGLGAMDARHLAVAESTGAKFLLTTDLKFISKCKNRNVTSVNVINPLDF